MKRLVHGIGINDGKYPVAVFGKHTEVYSTWERMIFRCTSKCWEKNPSYIGVTCSENFKFLVIFMSGIITNLTRIREMRKVENGA